MVDFKNLNPHDYDYKDGIPRNLSQYTKGLEKLRGKTNISSLKKAFEENTAQDSPKQSKMKRAKTCTKGLDTLVHKG